MSSQGKVGHIQTSTACLNSCFGWAVQDFAAGNLGLGSSYHPQFPGKPYSPLKGARLTLFAAVTHLMSYLWEGAITLHVTSKVSPTIRTWSIGSIMTDTGFSRATQRQAERHSMTAGPVTLCALGTPQGLATFSFPSSSVSLPPAFSFPRDHHFFLCTCLWEAVQVRESTAVSTMG